MSSAEQVLSLRGWTESEWWITGGGVGKGSDPPGAGLGPSGLGPLLPANSREESSAPPADLTDRAGVWGGHSNQLYRRVLEERGGGL